MILIYRPAAQEESKIEPFFRTVCGGRPSSIHERQGRTNTYDFTYTYKSTDKPVCQICTIVGHTADRCRPDYNYKPPPAKHLAAYVADMKFSSPDSRLLDSGATNHLPISTSLLSTRQPPVS